MNGNLKESNHNPDGNKDAEQSKGKTKVRVLAKAKSGEKESSKTLFSQIKFVFVPYELELSKGRIEVLKKQVLNNAGQVIELSLFNWSYRQDGTEVYIIVHGTMPWSHLNKLVHPSFHYKLKYFVYVNCEWISDCLRKDEFLDPIRYVRLMPDALNDTQVSDNPELSYTYPEPNLETGQQEIMAVKIENQSENTMKIETEQPSKILEGKQSIITVHSSDSLMIPEERNEIKFYLKIEQDADKFIRSWTKDKFQEYRELWDYMYGENALPMSGAKTEVSVDGMLIEKKEEQEFAEYVPDFDGDDDCQIVEVRDTKRLFQEGDKYKGSLFEGFDEYNSIDVELMQHEVKQFKAFKPSIKREKFWDKKKTKFAFQTGGTSKENHNAHITDELDKMLKIYTNEKDEWRVLAYRKVSSLLKNLPYKITHADQLKPLRGIGTNIKEKIKEVLNTGSIRKAKALENDERQKVVELFDAIWGVGTETALQFYQKGFRTLDDLRKNEHILNDNQKVGLKYYDDFNQRIPRDEVMKIVEIVTNKVEELSEVKGTYEIICCGSFRRGKATCGDVDILLTRKDGKPFGNFLTKVVKALEGVLLTDHLHMPKRSEHGHETYMGVGMIPEVGIHRRIDIKIYPREQYGFAVLYFTGSDHFNRSMRLFAKKKGYALDDHGLYPAQRSRKEIIWKGQSAACFTEEEVFRALGVEYKAPHEREI